MYTIEKEHFPNHFFFFPPGYVVTVSSNNNNKTRDFNDIEAPPNADDGETERSTTMPARSHFRYYIIT